MATSMNTLELIHQDDHSATYLVPAGQARIVQRQYDNTNRWNARTRVYVDDTVSNAQGDVLLNALVGAEAELGPLRHSNRGYRRDVDDLYRALNRRIAKVKTRMAVTTADLLIDGGVLVVPLGGTRCDGRFSNLAGGQDGCSPGVIIDQRLTYRGAPVDLHVYKITA